MSRPRLLDLFCGAGGAGMGYHRAGFDVVGVDLAPQPDYPFEFHQDNALDILEALVMDPQTEGPWAFDAIHASPPCQSFSRARHLRDAQGGECSALDLVAPTRHLLKVLGLPYIIENVPGAPLIDPVRCCGSFFDLMVQRHRDFESSVTLVGTECRHKKMKEKVAPEWWPRGVYHVMNDHVPSGGRTVRSLEEGREAMGIDWMQWKQLKESIPPAYTEWLGGQLIEQLAR